MTSNAYPNRLDGPDMGFPELTAGATHADDLVVVPTPAAASNHGKLAPYSGAIDEVLLGNAAGQAQGIGTPEARVFGTRQLVQRAVTGAASAADCFKEVYGDGSGGYTLTRPTSRALAVGFIARWLTGTTCIVAQYDMFDLRVQEKAACGIVEKSLGLIDGVSLANGAMLTDEPLNFHGEIIKLVLRCRKVPTSGGAGAATLKVQIKPAGGAYADVGAPATVQCLLADTLGLVKDSGAIATVLSGAAKNTFHDGDLLKVVASSVTAFTAGLWELIAICRTRPGV